MLCVHRSVCSVLWTVAMNWACLGYVCILYIFYALDFENGSFAIVYEVFGAAICVYTVCSVLFFHFFSSIFALQCYIYCILSGRQAAGFCFELALLAAAYDLTQPQAYSISCNLLIQFYWLWQIGWQNDWIRTQCGVSIYWIRCFLFVLLSALKLIWSNNQIVVHWVVFMHM